MPSDSSRNVTSALPELPAFFFGEVEPLGETVCQLADLCAQHGHDAPSKKGGSHLLEVLLRACRRGARVQ